MSTQINNSVNIKLADGVAGAKSANQEWLAADFAPNIIAAFGQRIHVFFAFNGADSIVQFTINGTDFRQIEEAALKDGVAYHKVIPLRQGDLFNIRAVTGITLDYCRVDLP